jgi:dienelactone hydrolase
MEALYRDFEARRNAQASANRSEALKQHLMASLGSFSHLRTELNPQLLQRVEFEDYVRERVEYSTLAGLRVPAYVLIPKKRANSGKIPAVLALHGHGYGSREIVGLASDGSENLTNPGNSGNFALELVKRGMLVMAPEVFGFGDRRLEADKQAGQVGNSSCYTLASHLLLYGLSLAGLRVEEARRALDYLVTRPEADPERLGGIGFSGGALLAGYTAALDQRLKATVLCAFTNTFKGSIMAVEHCLDNYLPGVLGYAELPELIGLIAPRPLFIVSGDKDPIFPVASLKQALAALQEIYKQAGAENALQFDVFSGSHEVNGQKAYPWLTGMLES